MYSNGDVEDCRRYRAVDNIRDRTLLEILKSRKFRDFLAESKTCTYGCRGQDPVEASKLWELQPGSFWNYLLLALQNR